MNRLFPLLLLLLWAANCTSPTTEANPNVALVNRAVDSLRQTFAPDKRTALWQPEVEFGPGKVTIAGETNFPEARKELIRILDKASIRYVDSLRVLPDSVGLRGKVYGVVNLSVANMRSEPKHSAELSTQTTLGTPLKVLKQEGDWYYVQTPDGYLGWLDAGGFVPMDAVEFQTWKKADKIVYLPAVGQSFASRNPKDGPVSDLLAGNILALDEEKYGRAYVRYPDGRTAVLPAKEVMPYRDWLTRSPPGPTAILQTAQNMLGTPYLWGGTSAKGMDCSGYTKTVFYLNGLQLPRDASQQIHVGQVVEVDTSDWSPLRPADLLFFGSYRDDGSPRITHVAIHEGEGRIIHATGRVKRESLNRADADFAEDRFLTFMGARRMLGAEDVPALRKVAAYQ